MSPNRTVRLTPRQAVWALIALMAMTTVLVLVVTGLVAATKSTEIRESQNELGPIIKNTDRTLEVLLDCTEPAGECYKRGQTNTQGAVEDITKYAVYAAVCVDQPGRQTLEETTICITSLVKAEALAQKDN